MNAAVRDQLLDRRLGHCAPVRVEGGEDDGARRVVDDEVDAGGQFEGADVAPFAADDAPLEVVARQVDHRHRGLDRVLGGAALDGFGDVLLRLGGGRLAGFGVEPLEEVGGVVPRLALDLLEQQRLGFLGSEAGDSLEFVLLPGDELLVVRGRGLGLLLALRYRRLAPQQFLLHPLERQLPLGELGIAAGDALLERVRLLTLLPRLTIGVRQNVVGLFLGVEEGFLAGVVGVARGVLEDAQRLFFRASDRLCRDALPVCHPDKEHRARRDEGKSHADEITGVWQHA